MQRAAAAAQLALVALLAMEPAPRCPADQAVNILRNGGAERETGGKPDDWYAAYRQAPSLRMWLESEGAFGGLSCFAIANEDAYDPPASNNWAQKLQFIPAGKTVRLAGYIRTAGADAANICVQCWGPDDRMIGMSSSPVFRGTHDWTFARAPDLLVPPATRELTVRAALTGKGKASFDDLRLEIVGEPPAASAGLREQVSGRILRVAPVTKDSMVLAFMPRWSHGDIDNIGVAGNDGGVRLLLAWDPPAPEEIARPILRFLLAMYCRESFGSSKPAAVNVHEILEDWSETISWGEQPRFAEQPAASFEISAESGWKILDLGPFIRAQAAAGRPGHGVLLRFEREDRDTGDAGWCGRGFVSREGIGENESRRPVLMVVDPDRPPATRPQETQLPGTHPPGNRQAADQPAGDGPAVPQPSGARPAEKPSAPAGAALLEYIEYLAADPDARIEVVTDAAAACLAARKEAGALANAQSGKLQQEIPDPLARDRALSALCIPVSEEFIQRYPLTPEGVEMMGGLAFDYQRAGRPQDALRLSAAAMRLARDTDLSCCMEVCHARLEAWAGKPDAAEARLRSVMARPVPSDPSDRRLADILFLAPEALAEVLASQGRHQQADKLLVELADHAMRHARRNPAQADLGRSWAVAAYKDRIRWILARDRGDVEAARKLIAEFQQKFPDAARTPAPGASVQGSTAADEMNAVIESFR